MKILVLNAGSSSLKYSLFDGADSHLVTHGLIEHLGESPERDHAFALQEIEQTLQKQGLTTNLGDCDAIGHRVVHGGEQFHTPILVDESVLNAIDELSELAPLHNPANLMPMQRLAQQYPDLPQVAVFDTAFHQTLPDYAYRYAIPKSLYTEHHIRRYGFHGTSHQYIGKRLAQALQQPMTDTHLISMHLGNGASLCAIENGQSIDTSMGFTPLEGLVMGTRAGDLDAAIPLYLIHHLGYDSHQVDTLLNKQSGLQGLANHNDMRELLELAEKGDADARLAIDVFVYHLVKMVGGYLAMMDKVDALVFTGGIGEHSAAIRAKVIEAFSKRFGLQLSPKNHQACSEACCISDEKSGIPIWIIPTQEEWEIAQQTLKTLQTV